ncbi:MAG: metallopeptidase TldD-related protein [Bryobacteraceae bacterium]|nr:metallopeptidase TldD-related protein [Bryobacteraceae bacterium]
MRKKHFLWIPFLCLAAMAQDPALVQKVNAALNTDPVLRAMAEELTRARNLRALGEAVYFAEISVDDVETFGVGATLGANFAAQRSYLRPVRPLVRVGGPRFDNTGSIYSDFFSGSRFDPGVLPIENSVPVLRHALWLAFDRAYKTAYEALGRKAAALRGVTQTEQMPDFWPATPVVVLEPPVRAPIDESGWTQRVKRLSAIFASYPAVTSSGVDFQLSQGMSYYLNTEGSLVRVADRIAFLRVRGSLQAPDGMVLYDGDTVEWPDPSRPPAEEVLRQATEAVARNLDGLARAPFGESYTGPVLFEGVAAAQIFAEVFGASLGVTRRPVSEPGRPLPWQTSELEGRLGLRVLPEWMDVIDDPGAREFQGRPLLGFYLVDLDGVRPQRLALVEKGVLKTLLTTRQPVRGIDGPNGRARLPGPFGVKIPRISNLFVQASAAENEAALKQRLLQLARQMGREYAVIIRKMDFPSQGSAEDLRQRAMQAGRSGAGGRLTSSPVLAYRVHLDGREELVRGLRFRSLGTRQFRDILAAGDRLHQFDYLDNGAAMALTGAGNYVVGCSVIAPSLLFEELELEAAADDLPKPPIVPPPPL